MKLCFSAPALLLSAGIAALSCIGLDRAQAAGSDAFPATVAVREKPSLVRATPDDRKLGIRAAKPTGEWQLMEVAKPSGYNSSLKRRTLPYVLKEDESLAELAERFELSEQAILEVNPVGDLTILEEGDAIQLPWMPSVLNHEDYSTSNIGEIAKLDPETGEPFSDEMIWPVGGTLTSGYGWRRGRIHAGIDIIGPTGTPILAAMDGTVVYSGWYYGYGYMIDIRHPNGVVTRYAHASRLYVSVGEKVSQGQAIMAMGSTGRSTAPHLHFEVRVNGQAHNPITYLPGSTPSHNLAAVQTP